MTGLRICLLGQVLVDTALSDGGSVRRLRLGGIFHAARAACALGIDYSVAYVAPDYLDATVAGALGMLGAGDVRKVGTVLGSPNVMLIPHVEEAGPMGYQLLLRSLHQVEVDASAVADVVTGPRVTDVLAFLDSHTLHSVLDPLSASTARLYVDGDVETDTFVALAEAGRQVECLILSTSTTSWLEVFKGSWEEYVVRVVDRAARSAVLKENRGGSRFTNGELSVTTGAVPTVIAHSVGVGDCFDLAFVALRQQHDDRTALAYASAVAADYASTEEDSVFIERARSTLRVDPCVMTELHRTVLHWEDRPNYQIYVAAPDFKGIERKHIDDLADALRYHNFRPRLPVREFGELDPDSSPLERVQTIGADLALLDECSLLVAVLLFNDPGTLIEMGICYEQGKPVILYDPYSVAKNLMLVELPTTVSATLAGVIDSVFAIVGEFASDRTE